MQVDIGKHVKIPAAILQTNQRPDIVVSSNKEKMLGMIERTVPLEVSGELKSDRYKEMVAVGERKGWKVRLWAVEVGCRGFPASSLGTFFREIGLSGAEKTKRLRQIGEVAQSASNAIWKWSHFINWGGNY